MQCARDVTSSRDERTQCHHRDEAEPTENQNDRRRPSDASGDVVVGDDVIT